MAKMKVVDFIRTTLNSFKKRESIYDYDFIDFGSGTGGSIEYCEHRMPGLKGAGIEISKKVLQKVRAKNLPIFEMNILDVEENKTFKFVSMFDFLEHLPNHDVVLSMLRKATKIAKDFILIRHPSFESIDYLKSHNLKIAWTDWPEHPCTITLKDFEKFFSTLGLTLYHFEILKSFENSDNEIILPLSAPPSRKYNAQTMEAKKSISFEAPIPAYIDIIVALRPFKDREWKKIVKTFQKKQ